MYILTVYISPENIVDDPHIRSFAIEEDSDAVVWDTLAKHYNIDKDSYHYYEGGASVTNGVFDTIEDDPVFVERLSWAFEVFEA